VPHCRPEEILDAIFSALSSLMVIFPHPFSSTKAELIAGRVFSS